MPKLFARQTALSNVRGRIDYISNPKRQENPLAVYDGADATYWKQLALECNLSSKYIDPKRDKNTVQGRELMFQLSNSLLERLTPEEIARVISKSFEEKYKRPCVVAVHFNKGKKSLHAHVIYSERELLPEPNEKIATRALFFDESGKRQYKKSAVLDENGQLRKGCRIVEKGEVYERRMFGPVEQEFSGKAWLQDAKSNWILPLRNGELRGDVEIEEFDHSSGEIPQQYIGNKVEHASPETAARIKAENQTIREFNQKVRSGEIGREQALEVKDEFLNKKERSERRNIILDFFRRMLGWNTGEKKVFSEPRKPSFLDLISGAEKRQKEQSSGIENQKKGPEHFEPDQER